MKKELIIVIVLCVLLVMSVSQAVQLTLLGSKMDSGQLKFKADSGSSPQNSKTNTGTQLSDTLPQVSGSCG